MEIGFVLLSAVAIGAALMVVTRRNPVYSAVWMLVCFISVAVCFLMLSAPFLAAIHVIVYTGAILVLFLFVIMLLNLKEDELGQEYPLSVKAACAAIATGLFVLIAIPVVRDPDAAWGPSQSPSPEFGTLQNVGLTLFNQYALPFELVSLLIIVAMFGAMVLAKKKLWT